MVMMRTLVATRGAAAGVGRCAQPQTSVSAAAASARHGMAIGDEWVMKRFYCLCSRESGIVLRWTSQKVAGTFSGKVPAPL